MEKIPVQPNTLVQMMGYQKELLDKYFIPLEGLPKYPIDLGTRASQKLMKDFIGRFIEELSEAYSELELVHENMDSNKPGQAQEHLIAYNLELADAWHFFLEILIYSGVNGDVLEEMCQAFIEEYPVYTGLYKPGQPLKFFMAVGEHLNHFADRNVIQNRHDRFIVATENDWVVDFRLAGGRRISHGLINHHEQLLWQITHEAMKLRNILNNREWHQTERALNPTRYKHQLMLLLTTMGLYMNFIGIGEIQIVNCYYFKNRQNVQRVKEKY